VVGVKKAWGERKKGGGGGQKKNDEIGGGKGTLILEGGLVQTTVQEE